MVQYKVCLSLKISSCSLNEAFTGTLLRETQAQIPTANKGITYMNAAFSKNIFFPVSATIWPPPIKEKIETPMIMGESNWTKLTPKFPTPAWIPNAVPKCLFGKYKEVEGMNEEKSPPPSPNKNAMTIKYANEVVGSMTANPNMSNGIILISVETVITFLVPNIGIRKVCMMRNKPPANPGMAAIQNNW